MSQTKPKPEPVTALILKPAEVDAHLAKAAAFSQLSSRFIRIHDATHRTAAIEAGTRIKSFLNEVEDFMRPHIDRAFKAHRALTSDLSRITKPAKEAYDVISGSVGAYESAERERVRRAEDAALRARQQELQAAEAERAKLEAKASAAELKGQVSAAATLRTRAIEASVVPDVVIPEYVAPEGAATRQNWKFRIENAALIPREYLIPDEKAIGAIVRAMKDKTNIPGVVPYPESKASFSNRS